MLLAGTLLQNRYRVIALLGQGGMGAVYQAQDLRLGQVVALKENLGSDPCQFQQEALLLANLRHPNLPRVIDHFVEPSGTQYLVMDFIEGEDLESRLARQGALPEAQVLAWFEQILDAIAYMHSRGVIHRDIKPANIKITSTGQAVLVDFGIAKVYQPGRPTVTGAKAATPGFASPEQYRGGTDARSDIYSLGATLYALVTGQVPPDALALAGRSAMLVPPRTLNSVLSAQTEQVILRAMAVLPQQRFQSVEEMRRALKSVPVAPTLPVQQPVPPQVPPTIRPQQSNITNMVIVGLATAVVVLALLLLGTGGVVRWASSQSATPTRAVLVPFPLPTPTLTATPRGPILLPTYTATAQLPTREVLNLIGQIAFQSKRGGDWDIYVMNANGTDVRWLASGKRPAWSPDGKTIAFDRAQDRSSDIYVIGTDGSNLRNLTQGAVWRAQDPAWAPHGKMIAFSAGTTNRLEIHTMGINAQTTMVATRITQTELGEAVSPAWSPDGRSIAFALIIGGHSWIYVMNADGTNKRHAMVQPVSDQSPAWSPDGQFIAFVSVRDGNYEIYVIDSNGTNPRRLTNNPANDLMPTWSPDGKFIAFTSNRDGNYEIYIMRSDGTGLMRVTNDPADDVEPAWSPR